VGPRAGLDAVAKRKIPSRCRESNPDRSARSVVTIPTELSSYLPMNINFLFCILYFCNTPVIVLQSNFFVIIQA
jgi:hypothetical protein